VYTAFGIINVLDILRRDPAQFRVTGRLEFWRGFGASGAHDRSAIMRYSMLHAISTVSPTPTGGAAGGRAGSSDDDDDD
jgi:hypothetical protein